MVIDLESFDVRPQQLLVIALQKFFLVTPSHQLVLAHTKGQKTENCELRIMS